MRVKVFFSYDFFKTSRRDLLWNSGEAALLHDYVKFHSLPSGHGFSRAATGLKSGGFKPLRSLSG